MSKLFYLALGACVYGANSMLWQLAEGYLTEGYGLHPVICGWLSALLILGTIVVAYSDRP